MPSVGGYDFGLNIPNPGEAFMNSFNQARQARLMQEQQSVQLAQQQQRQQEYAQWIQRLQTDRSPQTMSQFMLAFPEQADAITKAFEPMNAERKTRELGFYGQTLSALTRGDTETAKQLVQQRLDAARNTRGEEQTVQELEHGLQQIDSNPDALKSALALTVHQLDPKAYEALYGGSDLDTATIKNLVAEGYKPGTPEFKDKMREERTKVTVMLPGGGFFSGPADQLSQVLGGQPIPANAQRGGPARPKSRAEYDALPGGSAYYDPNGMIRTKPGGGSGNATGGFRP